MIPEIVEYKASNFKSFKGDKILIHIDFKPQLDIMNQCAAEDKMMVVVTNSGRMNNKHLKGTVVDPATMSNHMVFQAIDFNLQNIVTGEWYNSTKLGDSKGPDEAFIQKVLLRSKMRWGGNFRKKDDVHVDSGLNISNAKRWQEIYKKIHNG